MTTTAAKRLVDTKPKMTDRLPAFSRASNERVIEYEWRVSGQEVAVLSVSYKKAGYNYFTGDYDGENRYKAGIRREHDGLDGSRSYVMGRGYTTHKSEGVARFNRRKLTEFAEEALEHLRSIADDPRIAAFFDPDRDPNAPNAL